METKTFIELFNNLAYPVAMSVIFIVCIIYSARYIMKWVVNIIHTYQEKEDKNSEYLRNINEKLVCVIEKFTTVVEKFCTTCDDLKDIVKKK